MKAIVRDRQKRRARLFSFLSETQRACPSCGLRHQRWRQAQYADVYIVYCPICEDKDRLEVTSSRSVAGLRFHQEYTTK
jgi:hypothetical protein